MRTPSSRISVQKSWPSRRRADSRRSETVTISAFDARTASARIAGEGYCAVPSKRREPISTSYNRIAQPPCRGATISIRSPSASLASSRLRAGTKWPFSAVATVAFSYSSAFSAAASVAAASSCSTPLTMIRMLDLILQESRRGALGEGRREQEAVTIKAVEIGTIAFPDDARQVVRKSRPRIGAHLDDLGFAEGRMQRIGRAQKLDRAAGRHRPAGSALDRGGADHEMAVRARRDVERDARMQEAHRPRQF